MVDNHDAYVASGSNKKHQKRFQNCVNPHLLVGDPLDTVLGIINIPEHHLIICVVDKFLSGLEKIFGEDWVNEYLKEVFIIRKSYQGGHGLEGNQSSQFLKKLDHLEAKIDKSEDDLRIKGLAMVVSLRCFQQVQESCFGQILRDDYKECIKMFSDSYRDLENISVTPKIHIVEKHILDFFKDKDDDFGLGFYSEQSFESMHCDMKGEWERVKILDPNNPNFPDKLFNFVCAYNARHI